MRNSLTLELVKREAYELINRATETGITGGKRSDCVAAAALYCACRLNKLPFTQLDIAGSLNIAETTVRYMVKEMRKALKLDFPWKDL